ncbi:MAG: hypothetical protein JO329_14315 [Planctomycetaceae bacterium]|nr:hypothetical protein [Planctomycetaceae bacterium]
MIRSLRLFGLILGLGIGGLGLAPASASAQAIEVARPPRVPLGGVDEIRRTSASWDRRNGAERRVVDQVVLVPDVATFLEAIAWWDEGHWFPILIDDVELTFKFLRAFRPARVVRYPRRVAPPAPEKLWDRAIAAVGRSWSGDGRAGADLLPGDAAPHRLGSTPPGVVLSSPDSPMLAGAVALAAGRFQPLIRWEVPKRFADTLTAAEAVTLARQFETLIADRYPNYGKLGDDCDFVTLAGDWPYRYHVRRDDSAFDFDLGLDPRSKEKLREMKEGDRAFDDLIGRSNGHPTRWCFCGRLIGDATANVYRAMCSLFLQPRSALLWNAFADPKSPWSDYAMTVAASRLAPILAVTHRSGEQAGLAGWHRVFDPVNRFGLVMINTHGSPRVFNLTDGPGVTGDVPPSEPAIVLMIHSFSAADPTDPGTIAGRWLANGAFIYFGSMNEPFLRAFRPPSLVTALIAEDLPLSVALRQSPPEVLGQPWRLLFLGDPLYRILPPGRSVPRLPRWDPIADWPAYREFLKPDPGASDDVRLNWALKTAIFRLQGEARPRQRIDLAADLLAIERERLGRRVRPIYDALLADSLLQDDRADVLLARLARIPAAERTPSVRRQIETCQLAMLQKLVANRDVARAGDLWAEVVRSEPPRDLLELITARVGALADTSRRRDLWRDRLRAAVRGLENPPAVAVIEAELKRLDGPSDGTRAFPGGAR